MSQIQSRAEVRDNLPGKIKNRFKILLAEKEADLGRRIPYREIRDEIIERTGVNIAESTISSWANHDVERYDAVTLIVFLDYFKAEIGDLLEYISFAD